MTNGSKPLTEEEGCDLATAKALAKVAIDTSDINDTELGWERSEIGIINDLETQMHGQVQRLARA